MSYVPQLSSFQEFPPDIISLIPSNAKNYATNPFRIISLKNARNGEFTVIYPNEDSIHAKTMKNYTTQKLDNNHLWRFIQVSWENGNACMIQHVVSGKYLCVQKGHHKPSLLIYDKHNNYYSYLWKILERGLFSIQNHTKYYCYSAIRTGGTDPSPQFKVNKEDPMTLDEFKQQKNPNLNINLNIPVSGKVFLRIDDHNISMSIPQNEYYYNPNYYQAFWWGRPVIIDNPINDIENEWYFLISRVETGLCLPPVSENLGIGLFKNLDIGKSHSAKFCRSRIPLQERFVDPLSQTKPQQTQFPRLMTTAQPSATETYLLNNRSFKENFEFWQYVDIFLYNANDQGSPPPELMNLFPPRGLDIDYNNIDKQNLFDVMDGFISSQGTGIFSSPPRYLIENAHKNGCKFFNSLFFQQNVFGGRWRWWSDFLKDRETFAKKFVDYAHYYGIDGFFINFEAQPSCDLKDTPDTNCSYLKDKCDIQKCKGYWCMYTEGGANNCDGTDCTIGSWDKSKSDCNTQYGFLENASNYGPGNSDINKKYLIEFLRYFRKYREEKNINVEIVLYASMGPGGSSANYSSGITNYLLDLWIDPDTNQPLVDYILSMPAGGLINPKDILSTYSHSGNVTSNIIEKYEENQQIRYHNTGKLKNIQLMKSASPSGSTGPSAPTPQPPPQPHSKRKKFPPKNSYQSTGWPINTGPNTDEKICLVGNYSDPCDIPESDRRDCMGPSGGEQDKCNANESCCYEQSDNAPWCYKKKDSNCDSIICPVDSCGSLSQNPYIPKNRPYDFFVGTTIETGFDNPNFSSIWDKYLYCGCQTNDPYSSYLNNSKCPIFPGCQNYIDATQKPLSSLFLWGMGRNIDYDKSTYEQNIKNYYYKLFMGKTGLCNKNLQLDPYEDCASDNTGFANCGAKNMGLCHYFTEKSVLNKLPFHTSFCTGNGDNFYLNGFPQTYYGSWFDGIQDYLPTWRWWSKQKTSKDSSGRYLESDILSINYSKSFYGGSSLKISSKYGMTDTDFYLFKTRFSTDKKIKLKITYCADKVCNKVMIGYILASKGNLIDDPQINYFNLDKIHTQWSTKTFIINTSPNDYISSLCLKALQPDKDEFYNIYIGKICLEYEYHNEPEPPIITKVDSFTQSETGLTNFNVFWTSDIHYDYYNIYYGRYFVGRVYGNKNPLDHNDLIFNLQNMKKSYNSFRVEGITSSGKTISSQHSHRTLKNIIMLFLLITLLIYLVYNIYYQTNILSQYKYIIYVSTFILFLIIMFYTYSISSNIKNMNIHVPKSIGASGLTNNSLIAIENWSDCKSKAFNINFDDNRPMAWSWLLTNLEKMKSPIKVTFFVNSSWLNRDLDVYKSWMKKYKVDFQAHGHWHKNHTKDDFISKPGAICWGDNRTPNECCVDNPDKCISDKDLAENDKVCAKLLRKYIYEDNEKDLIFAYPYGAYPFDDNGNVKPETAKVLQQEYIAARGVQWGQVLEFPDNNKQDSLLGLCANYQGQPAGCDNACSVSGCNSQKLKLYDDNVSKYIGPEYSWPGGIDLNIDYECQNCSVVEQMKIRKQSLINMLNQDLPISLMLWGHDFNPTNSDGKVYPCNLEYTKGGCDSDACKSNVNSMAQKTENVTWLNEKYTCPSEIANKYDSCAVDCVRGAVDKDGKCKDTNVFKDAYTDPFKYFQIEKAKSNTAECNQCFESCWDPSDGSVLLEMLQLVSNRKDLWFAFFVEIVQYLWNRKYSQLSNIKYENNILSCNLITTNKMKKYPLTISFVRGSKPVIHLDGTNLKVHESSFGKYYVKFIPKDNYTHNIKIM